MKPEHIEDVLVHLHTGQWFGWSNSKNKVYENLVIHYADREKPTKEWLESELQRQQNAYDADDYKRERQVAYAEKIPVGDQLDSLLRWAKSMKEDSGVDLPSDLDEILVSWLTVKAEIPKI
jgi:hypothetical protein